MVVEEILKTFKFLKEFLALGMANIAGSFFKCFNSAGALARTVVFESSGGKTQVNKHKLEMFRSNIVTLVS